MSKYTSEINIDDYRKVFGNGKSMLPTNRELTPDQMVLVENLKTVKDILLVLHSVGIKHEYNQDTGKKETYNLVDTRLDRRISTYVELCRLVRQLSGRVVQLEDAVFKTKGGIFGCKK